MHIALVTTAVGSMVALPVSALTKHVLHFSDIHLNISADFNDTEARRMRCRYGGDATITMLESALAYASTVLPDPEVLLYTGDHVVHGDHHTDEFIRRAVAVNVDAMERYYPHTSRVKLHATAIFGNADFNLNYGLAVTDPAIETNPSIELISNAWNSSLSPSRMDQLRRRGCLRYDLDDRLSILTLNTVQYSPNLQPHPLTDEDPFQQFTWLNETLYALRQSSRFAYIAGHLPPAVDSNRTLPQWTEQYAAKYKSIIRTYRDVVKAQLFGHVHSIEFRVAIDDRSSVDEDLPPLFMTGALSIKYDNNPTFTVWEYDANSYELLDFTVYSTNVSDAEQQFSWAPLYRASAQYNLSSLSVSALWAVANQMSSDPALLERYYWDRKGQSHRQPPCTSPICHAEVICSLAWWGSHEDFIACVDATLDEGPSHLPASMNTTVPATVPSLFPVATVASMVACAALIAVGLAARRRTLGSRRRCIKQRVVHVPMKYEHVYNALYDDQNR